MNYANALDDVFKQFEGPRFGVKLWDGKIKYYGTGSTNSFVLCINKPYVVKRLIAEGALGFGESYMDNSLEIEGDLEAYLKLRHQFKRVKPSIRLIITKFIADITTPRNRNDQIAYHYDLGNEFFSLFLDKGTMSYSSAHYLSQKDDLEKAQFNKLKLICNWLDLPKNSSILELGSGWGGFAEYTSKNHGWNVYGNTLSKKQLEYARKRIHKQTLNDKVTFEFQDFLSELPQKQYDGVVMIEAIEHVGQANLDQFIKSVSKNLKPGAPFYLQFTGRYKIKSFDPWTLKYVFPGSHLPAKSEFLKAVEASGLKVERFEDHTEDYKKTMAMWKNSLESHQGEIEKMFDKKFFRLWKLWMNGAYVNFDVGDMNLFRVLLRKN